MRAMWLILGLAAVGAGAAGAVLPLLPATPFLLVAAFCFARSSPRLHAWLTNHRLFGPLIENWRLYGAIGVRSKIAAVLVMAATFGISLWSGLRPSLLAVQGLVLASAALFILTRPNAPSDDP